MNINGSTIVVTGGAGLIGSTTIDVILREHDPRRIVILDNLSRGTTANIETALKDPRASLVEGDIRDRAMLARTIAGADAVIHMAAIRITACAAEPRDAFEVMCGGAYNVVEAAQQAGVRRWWRRPRRPCTGWPIGFRRRNGTTRTTTGRGTAPRR